MKSIGIDIGTTTISFAVTDNDTLAVIQKYTIASAGFIHTENPWERIQDTDVILSRIRPVLNDILDTYSDISAIGITSQMHGIVYTDRKSPLVHISQAAGMGLFELYKLIETGTGSRKTKLIASGNAVRKNSIFQQILAERFHMPLTIGQNEEEAAYGASLCALYSSGQLSKNQLPV